MNLLGLSDEELLRYAYLRPSLTPLEEALYKRLLSKVPKPLNLTKPVLLYKQVTPKEA